MNCSYIEQQYCLVNMHKFYFSNKGVTRKAGCPNLWPVSDKQFSNVPQAVFDTPGLVVHIEPKIVGGVPMAKIAIFDPSKVWWRPRYGFPDQQVMMGGCIMHAEYYNSGRVVIESVIAQLKDNETGEDLERDWRTREAAISVLKQAVELFVTYFPKLIL